MPDNPKLSDELKRLRALGINLEPDTGPGPYHRAIAFSAPIPNTKTGQRHVLQCGHYIQTFGNIALANGKVFCQQCKDLTQ